MIDIPYPDVLMQRAELVEEMLFRGTPGERLTDRLEFGGPIALGLDPADVREDPDLVAFIGKESATMRYAQVHSAVSFRDGADSTELVTANVAFNMTNLDGGPAPIAWSLAPASAAVPFETTLSFSLGPKLKLLGAEIEAGAVQRTTTSHGDERFMSTTGLLTSNPAWRFTRTGSELEGSYRLILIVRAAVGTRAEIAVTLAAAVKGTRGLRRFRKAAALERPGEPIARVAF